MLKPQFGELFIDNSESDRNAIHLYISQPSPLEEKNLGRLFVLIEFEEPGEYYEDIIELIDRTFSHSYYRSSDFEVEAAFERSMQKVNKAVQELVGQFGEDWTYRFNALLGIIHSSEIHLAYVGSVEAFLIQKGEIVDILQKDKTAEIKPLKLFTNVLSGQCSEDATMVFSTTNLLDYLSLEKIKRTVQGNVPVDSSKQLELILTENTILSNIAGLVLGIEDAPANLATDNTLDDALNSVLPTSESSDAKSVGNTGYDDVGYDEFSQPYGMSRSDSMDKLINQERATGELLTPSIWPSVKKRFVKLGSGIKTRSDMSSDQTGQSANYVRSKNRGVEILKQVGILLKNIGIQLIIGLSYVTKKIIALIQNNKSMSGKMGKMGSSVQGSVQGIGGWFSRLSGPRKVFLVLASAVLFVFVMSLVMRDSSNDKQAETASYEDAMNSVQNLVGEVESKQIMNDEAGARSAVAEAETILNTIPQDSDIYTQRGNALRDKINQYTNEFNKVTALGDVVSVGDFNGLSNAETVKSIAKIGDNIFAFNGNNESTYRLNLTNGSTSEVLSGSTSSAAYMNVENDSAATVLASITENTFVQFNPVLEKTSPVSVDVSKNMAATTDIDIFGSRLYVLDASTNQIYRHTKLDDAYGSATAWLDDDLDISQAVAFDIDGSIYVLQSDGRIRQFDDGSETELSIDEFNPSLAGATRIVKPDTTSNFYILNPTTQRIVVINSSGELEQQYTANQFTDLKDIVLDTDTNTLYVLSGTAVYSIDL